MLDFLTDPYGAAPVTLQMLDSALVVVNEEIRKQTADYDPEAGSGTNLAGGAAAGLLSGGSAALPVVLAGATEFFVQRAQDEVAFAFIINLRDNLRKDSALVFQAFPRSYALMRRIDSETFQTLTPALRSTFLADLDDLPSRSSSLIDKLTIPSERKIEVQGYLEVLGIVYERGREIRQGIPPSVALSNLVAIDETKISDQGTRRALRMVGLVAREYSAAAGEPMIQDLANRDRGWLRRYFVALLARELIRIEAGHLSKYPGTVAEQTAAWKKALGEVADSVMPVLRDREADVILLLNQLHTLRGEAERVRADAAQRTEELRANPQQLFSLAGSVLGVLRTAPRFAHLSTAQPPPALVRFDSIVNEAARLHEAVVQKDYVTVINWVAQNPRFSFCEDPAGDICRARQQFLSLASSLATAEDAEEVTTALRAASSPVGSYRAKRSQTGGWFTPRTVSLIGYLGGARYQTAAGDTLPEDVDGGLALPVGPELSFGAWWGAISIFVPILDLGPVANQAIGIGDSDPDAEIRTQELFAPGVGIVLNLTPGAPLSVGAAVTSAYRPDGDGDGTGTRVARSIIFIGIDATLFHLRF